jgi:hypothetical protein
LNTTRNSRSRKTFKALKRHNSKKFCYFANQKFGYKIISYLKILLFWLVQFCPLNTLKNYSQLHYKYLKAKPVWPLPSISAARSLRNPSRTRFPSPLFSKKNSVSKPASLLQTSSEQLCCCDSNFLLSNSFWRFCSRKVFFSFRRRSNFEMIRFDLLSPPPSFLSYFQINFFKAVNFQIFLFK